MDPVETRKKRESLIGRTFADRFRITGFLGEGGMGRIYLAEQVDMSDREVALKVLHTHLGDESEVVARFEREMKAATLIEHPNSVRVYEYGKVDDRLFLVMEFVDGESLGEALLDHAPFPWPRVVEVTRQVAAALAAAHAKGIVHRDLKPDNVMLTSAVGRHDHVKVCDFGLARFVGTHDVGDDEDTDFKTAVGVRVGTPHYMPPEYISEFKTDHRGDLYALGVLMYEMATGRPPFDGRPYEVMNAHVSRVPEPPSSLNPSIPGWLDQVVLALLRKKPADRPQSAEALIAMLDREPHPDASTEELASAGSAAVPTMALVLAGFVGAGLFAVVLVVGVFLALCLS